MTNMAMSIVVARNVTATEFGSYAVAFLIFSLTVGAARALIAQPLSVKHSAEGPAQRSATMRAALGAVLKVAVAVSAGLIVYVAVAGGPAAATLLALALMLPSLIVQDTCRFAFFASARPDLATLNDVIWAVVQFSLMAVVIAAGLAGPAILVLSWGLGATVAAAVAMVQLRAMARPGLAMGWLRLHWPMSRFWLGEFAAGQGASQGGILLVGGSLGPDSLGSLRAAQTLVGPLGILSGATMTFGIPEVSRKPSLPRGVMLLASLASGMMFCVGLVYVAILLMLPPQIGQQLFGDSWSGARSVLPAVAAASVISGLKLGPVIVISGRGLSSRSFPLVLLTSILSVIFMVIGARIGDVQGLAWGIALAEACVIPLWFWQLRQVVVRERSGALRDGSATAD